MRMPVRALLRSVLLGSLILSLLVFGRVFAFHDDGHFYTAVTIEHNRVPSLKDRQLAAKVLMTLCAQLPDLSKEFDPVTLRVNLQLTFNPISFLQGSLWGAFSSCWGTDICHMVTVHHYLHGLTDSDAEAVTEAAMATLESLLRTPNGSPQLDPVRVCAAGFAIHLLGDSFAHRRLKEPMRMYPPGHGHAFDDENPDFILFNGTRARGWMTYAKKLDEVLKAKAVDARWDELTDLLTRSFLRATLDHRYNESMIRDGLKTILAKDVGVWSPYDPAVESLTTYNWLWQISHSCQEVFKAYARYGIPTVDCNEVWKTYKEAVIPQFNWRNIRSKCDPDDEWTSGESP